MPVKIIKESKLSNKRIEDIIRLYDECNKNDKTRYIFDDDDEYKYQICAFALGCGITS